MSVSECDGGETGSLAFSIPVSESLDSLVGGDSVEGVWCTEAERSHPVDARATAVRKRQVPIGLGAETALQTLFLIRAVELVIGICLSQITRRSAACERHEDSLNHRAVLYLR
jgi:hypothetical protein